MFLSCFFHILSFSNPFTFISFFHVLFTFVSCAFHFLCTLLHCPFISFVVMSYFVLSFHFLAFSGHSPVILLSPTVHVLSYPSITFIFLSYPFHVMILGYCLQRNTCVEPILSPLSHHCTWYTFEQRTCQNLPNYSICRVFHVFEKENHTVENSLRAQPCCFFSFLSLSFLAPFVLFLLQVRLIFRLISYDFPFMFLSYSFHFPVMFFHVSFMSFHYFFYFFSFPGMFLAFICRFPFMFLSSSFHVSFILTSVPIMFLSYSFHAMVL